jgi:hypothetical protein
MAQENNKNNLRDPNNKLERFVAYLKETQGSRFTGYIKINFSQGNIGRVEKFEEILKK